MNASRECRCEVVWDAGLKGTAESPSGEMLPVEEGGPWTPWRMLSAAVQASLMFEFFRLAGESGLEVLGYVSNAGLAEDDPSGRMILVPCILVENQSDVPRAEELLELALTRSQVCRQLGGGLEMDARFAAARQASA